MGVKMTKHTKSVRHSNKTNDTQLELSSKPIIQPDYSNLQTGDRMQHVANSKANDRSSSVAGVQTGKHYPDYNSAYRTPEQMGNFVNSDGVPSHNKNTDNVRLKHISVNPQRRFDDSQLDRPFSVLHPEEAHGRDDGRRNDGRVVHKNKRHVVKTRRGRLSHEIGHPSETVSEK